MNLSTEELTILVAKLKEQLELTRQALEVLGELVKVQGQRIDALEDKLLLKGRKK